MPLTTGTLLQGGKYRIVRHISSGGFGVTYEAEHILLHKRLVIKEFFMKDFFNRDEETNHVTVGTKTKIQLVSRLKRKFMDEAVSISSLSHPNIVNVSDVFEENGTAYYVMDLIDGKSLHQLVNEKGALPEKTAVDYIRQIAKALEYVHSNNRLHLDIKPGNIMINGQGKAILIDFGASKQYDEVDGENTSTLMGKTPGYAPIEQMGNRVQTFSPATDIYSLGATLYKLLSGETPPDSTDLADDETLLRPLPNHISEATRNAVMKAMEVKRKNRPQSMKEFLALFGVQPAFENDDEATVIDTPQSQPQQKTQSKPQPILIIDKEEKESVPEGYIVALGIILIAVICFVIAVNLNGDKTSNTVSPTKTENVNLKTSTSPKTENVKNMKYTNSSGVVTGYYTGRLVNGKMDGQGEFKYMDGSHSKGTFKNDRITSGRVTTKEGYYFDGTFSDGEPYNGTWYEPNGTVNSKVKNGVEE